MSNLIDSALFTKEITAPVVSTLTGRLAFIGGFATLCPTGENPARDSQTIFATTLPEVAVDSSDFEAGAVVLDKRPALVHLYSQSWGMAASEIQGGLSPVALAQANAEKLADKICDVCLAPLTAANFGTPAVTAAASAFAVGDFDTLWSSLSAPDKIVVLDGPHFVKVKNTWLPPGFSNVAENGRWTGAESKVKGFAACPRALIVRHGLPKPPPANEMVQRQVLTIPGGLEVELSVWVARASRSIRCSLQLYLGVGLGDATALNLLKIP